MAFPRPAQALTLLLAVAAARGAPTAVSFTRVLANYPRRVFEAQGTVIDGDLFAFGGFLGFPSVTRESYSRPVTGNTTAWTRRADMPEPVTHMAQAVFDGRFCGAGGYLDAHPGRSVNSTWCYDKATDAWTRLPDLPGDRAGGGLVRNTLAGKDELIFAGGGDREDDSLDLHTDHGTTWTLDLATPNATWVDTGATMPNPRNHMAGVEACGRFFFVGGQHGEDETSGNQDTVSEYVPATNSWANVAPLPKPLGHISASVVAYQCGFLVVGGTTQGRKHSSDVYFYDPDADTWALIGQYPIALATPVCGVLGDKLMCATAGPWQRRDEVYIGMLM